MKIDDSIKFIEFVLESVFFEGALEPEKIKKQFREVLKQLKLAKVDILRQEIIDLENEIEVKKDLLEEAK